MIVPQRCADEFAGVLAAHVGTELADRFLDLGELAVHMQLGDAEGDGLKGSRVGGYPVLPAGVPWPSCVDESAGDRRLLVCMAVLDLAQLASYSAITGLPAEGFLTFFYADDADMQPWGELDQVGGWQVIYAPPGAESVAKAPEAVTIWREYSLVPEPAMSYPRLYSTEELEAFAGGRLSDDAYSNIEDGFYDCRQAWAQALFGDVKWLSHGHQLGGIPDPSQDDPIAEADAQFGIKYGGVQGVSDRRLLLQLDADSRIAEMIQTSLKRPQGSFSSDWLGQDFTLYYLIQDTQLRQRDFSQVWLIAQR